MTLYMQEEIFSFDHFDIWDEDGNVKYQVDRELFQFGRKLVVRDAAGTDFSGSFMSLEFEITQGARRVAYIEKAWPAFHDRYRLEIADGNDELTALCVVLAIDMEAERHN